MAWTYTDDPTNVPRDRVRVLVHDTDTNRQLVTDAQIAWALIDGGDAYGAAAILARVIASDLGAGSVTVGDMSESDAMSASDWLAYAQELQTYSNVQGSPPGAYFGGSSIDRRDAVAADTDRRPPVFAPFQFTRPGSVTSTGAST